MDQVQKIQEQQYEFPYHYLPRVDDAGFTKHVHWSWGIRYIGGLKFILDMLKESPEIQSVIDIGCDDVRLLMDINQQLPEIKATGIDYSERAINLAKAKNPTGHYLNLNILETQPDAKVDAIILMEVIEHILGSGICCITPISNGSINGQRKEKHSEPGAVPL